LWRGFGSIELNISGGSSSVTGTNYYDIRVTGTGPSGIYSYNYSHDPNDTTFLIENLDKVGSYDITVTDSNGCSKSLTNINLTSSSNNLAATGILTLPNCNSFGSNRLDVTWLQGNRGNGNNTNELGEPYPIWQKQVSLDKKRFTIGVSGNLDNYDLTSIGVSIKSGTNSQTIYANSNQVSITSLQEAITQLYQKIRQETNYSVTLDGSIIEVSGDIIDDASPINNTASGSGTLNFSTSSISNFSYSDFQNLTTLNGSEQAEDLSTGIYRILIGDNSGCGETGVINQNNGSYLFEVYDPQIFEFKNIDFDKIINCNAVDTNFEFSLSNGLQTLTNQSFSYTISLTLNSIPLVLNSDYFYLENTRKYQIPNLVPLSPSDPDYELIVTKTATSSPVCVETLPYYFRISNSESITYEGKMEYEISTCDETFKEDWFFPANIRNGVPFEDSTGKFYRLEWEFTPSDPNKFPSTIITYSRENQNVPFEAMPGSYKMYIYDSNGCTATDSSGDKLPFEFIFNKSLDSIEVLPAGGVNGDQFSSPVSCEINSQDGRIHIDVSGLTTQIIRWHKQSTETNIYSQLLTFQGNYSSNVVSEVYAITINSFSIFYETLTLNESVETIISQYIDKINASPLNINASIKSGDPKTIEITSTSSNTINLEVVSKNNLIKLTKTSVNNAQWVPVENSDNSQDLDNLSEGLYRYRIYDPENNDCQGGSDANIVEGFITVENENILEIREGPLVDEYLCNGQPGTLFIDIYDGNTGPLTFFYNSTPVTYEAVGTNQYIINIDNPVESATLEIYNTANCGLSREINIGNGTPLFEFTSTNFLQSGTYLAREDVTFVDNSENEYDSFEFVFGDGTQSELLERNSPEPVIHEYAISGTYYVTLRIYNDLGCTEELTKTIKIGKGYSILMPNVFTPNGDIWNSTFRPVFNGLSEITLRVYDAQGGLLYEEVGAEGSDPDMIGISLRGWPGDSNLPSSPYFIYTITAKTIDDEPVFRDGTFILLQ
jgi:hypothetical protein